MHESQFSLPTKQTKLYGRSRHHVDTARNESHWVPLEPCANQGPSLGPYQCTLVELLTASCVFSERCTCHPMRRMYCERGHVPGLCFTHCTEYFRVPFDKIIVACYVAVKGVLFVVIPNRLAAIVGIVMSGAVHCNRRCSKDTQAPGEVLQSID